MDFFTNFVSAAEPTKSFYRSTGIAGDTWFLGSATPGFAIGGCVLVPTGFSGGAAIAARTTNQLGAGWLIEVTAGGHLNVTYVLTDSSTVTLDGGPITPGCAWPFLVDIYDDGLETVGKLYIPVAGSLANIADQNTAAQGIYYAPPATANRFTVGQALLVGGDSIHINGLTTRASVSPGGLPTATVEAFFQGVKDTLTLPVLDGVNPDSYVDASLVYPDAPLTYVTTTPPASGLTQQNQPPSIENVAVVAVFVY
jgi:hypothetical protein